MKVCLLTKSTLFVFQAAQDAMGRMNEKLIHGRHIVVTYAQEAPLDASGTVLPNKRRKGMLEVGRPTTLSLIKTGGNDKRRGQVPHLMLWNSQIY